MTLGLRDLLWIFAPDWAMPLIVAGLGIAVILGVIRARAALGIVAAIILLLVGAPIVEALFTALPWWVSALAILWFALAVVRGVLTLFLGEEAAGHVIGAGVVGSFALFLRALVWPFRVLARNRNRPPDPR